MGCCPRLVERQPQARAKSTGFDSRFALLRGGREGLYPETRRFTRWWGIGLEKILAGSQR